METKMKKTCKNITWWIGVTAIGIVFGISLQFAGAWVDPPAAAPPGGNLGAPINTGSVTQTRGGTLYLKKALGVEGVLIAYANAIVEGTLKVIGDGDSGSFQFRDGNQGEGKVLTSSDSGMARWDDAQAQKISSGLYGFCITDCGDIVPDSGGSAPCFFDNSKANCESGYSLVRLGQIEEGGEGGCGRATYSCIKN